MAQDVTAPLEAEEALRLRDRAIQAVTQGILITDPSRPDNPVVYASPGRIARAGTQVAFGQGLVSSGGWDRTSDTRLMNAFRGSSPNVCHRPSVCAR
jgi:hypothetical protein